MSEQPMSTTARLKMEPFERACGHPETMMWTIGDEAQAANYRATPCSHCRTFRQAPKFGRGRNSSR